MHWILRIHICFSFFFSLLRLRCRWRFDETLENAFLQRSSPRVPKNNSFRIFPGCNSPSYRIYLLFGHCPRNSTGKYKRVILTLNRTPKIRWKMISVKTFSRKTLRKIELKFSEQFVKIINRLLILKTDSFMNIIF